MTGTNEDKVIFDASCSVNPNSEVDSKNFRFYWFCCKSKQELPTQKHFGKFLRKGSCFGWNPSFFGEGQKISIERHRLLVQEKFFVRVFISSDGFSDQYDDQEVILHKQAVPILRIQ